MSLAPVDWIQQRFFGELGVTEEEALVEHHLAPLSVRRDIAMLGLIHRAALRKGQSQLQKLFRRPSPARRQIEECNMQGCARILKRSAFGLVPVYNNLLEDIRREDTAKGLQHALQKMVKQGMLDGSDAWRMLLSPRHRQGV